MFRFSDINIKMVCITAIILTPFLLETICSSFFSAHGLSNNLILSCHNLTSKEYIKCGDAADDPIM